MIQLYQVVSIGHCMFSDAGFTVFPMWERVGRWNHHSVRGDVEIQDSKESAPGIRTAVLCGALIQFQQNSTRS